MADVIQIGSRLFEGAVVSLSADDYVLTPQDCVDMFKLGWRMMEGKSSHCGRYEIDERLQQMGLEMLNSLLLNKGKQ